MSKKELFQKEAVRFVTKITNEYAPEKIYIFGSFVNGRLKTDSDIDLFIIKKTKKNRMERAREVSKILMDREVPVDILVYTPSEVARRSKLGDSFILGIINNGRLMYDKK